MIDKRLLNLVSESKKYIAANVALQWTGLLCNICIMASISIILSSLWDGSLSNEEMIKTMAVIFVSVAVRFVTALLASKAAYFSSKQVKSVLRERIYKKLLKLGPSYSEKVRTSEAVQFAVEGVDQLEVYFSSYMPQFFYAMLAPLTLFVVLAFISFRCAIILLICVPLIPVSIVAVQKWAKKLLSKYWGRYTALGDTFLENLQGLTTLKIYMTDSIKRQEMAEKSEEFRKITMKVLTMQLNSITVMDIIAYGGAALGTIIAIWQYSRGDISLAGCLMIILLSADFFIPMRMLGSFFHIAMNGMAAAGKIFTLLDMEEMERTGIEDIKDWEIALKNIVFSYDGKRNALDGADMEIKANSFTAIVGESGCGKSTAAALIMGKRTGYIGNIEIGDTDIKCISQPAIMKKITYIGHNSHIFKGTVRENLLMGCPTANDEKLWEVLERVRLADFLKGQQGLDTALAENGSNFSGGQRQRLALARAILHDSSVYIFDEATSNIDVESENDIMEQISVLARSKAVVLISHRLANVAGADRIYVMDKGKVREFGSHEELLKKDQLYARLWRGQREIENLEKERMTA